MFFTSCVVACQQSTYQELFALNLFSVTPIDFVLWCCFFMSTQQNVTALFFYCTVQLLQDFCIGTSFRAFFFILCLIFCTPAYAWRFLYSGDPTRFHATPPPSLRDAGYYGEVLSWTVTRTRTFLYSLLELYTALSTAVCVCVCL